MKSFLRSLALAGAIDAADAFAATFTVTNTNVTGAGSLQQALWDANTNAGSDSISFNIVGSEPYVISPTIAQPLPSLTNPVMIDGYTQPGASANTLTNGNDAVLKVRLDGTSAGSVNGLRIASSGSVIRGLSITRFRNSVDGIAIASGTNNVIEGNFVGLDPTAISIGNGRYGVSVAAGASGNVIGGTNPAAANVICGNLQYGVMVQGNNNIVRGNLIGLRPSGVALGNNSAGVLLNTGATGNTIGGETPAARNVISGNTQNGVELVNANFNSVQGNFIGVDFTGTVRRPNTINGIFFQGGLGNLIGGTNAFSGNVISGNNQHGIRFQGNSISNQVLGNFIGTDLTGTLDLNNRSNGVFFVTNTIAALPWRNTVGSTNSGGQNMIAFNQLAGVSVSAGTNNAIRANRIFRNSGLGIDVGTNGATANDPGDADTGANQQQNFPVLTNAIVTRTNVILQGALNSAANASFQVDFFANTTCDSSGTGEGETWLGATEVTTDPSGNASFEKAFPGSFAAAALTVTATDTNGNTSEFSACLEALAFVPTQTFTVTTTNDSGPGSLRQALLDGNADFSHDTINFNIPGAGVKTIFPLSALPTPLDPVTLDGYTQPGTVPNTLTNGIDAVLKLQLDGSLVGGPGVDGLHFTTRGNTVRGLSIVRFTGDGIEFNGGGGNEVKDVWVGVDITPASRPAFLGKPENKFGGPVYVFGEPGCLGYGFNVTHEDADYFEACRFAANELGAILFDSFESKLVNVVATDHDEVALDLRADGITCTDCVVEDCQTGILINADDCTITRFSCSGLNDGVWIQTGTGNHVEVGSACTLLGQPIRVGSGANNNQLPPSAIWSGAGPDGGRLQFQGTISGQPGPYTAIFESRTVTAGVSCYQSAASFSFIKSGSAPVQVALSGATENAILPGTQGAFYLNGPDGCSIFSADVTVAAARPNLMTAATASPASANVGTPQVCTVTITSNGEEPVSSPGLTIALPAAATGPVDVFVTGGEVTSLTPASMVCNFNALLPGQSGSVTFEINPVTSGTLNLTATASALGQTELTTLDNAATVTKSIAAGSNAAPSDVTYSDTSSAGNDRCPISTLTGELYEPLTPDLGVGGPMPLGFRRYYASFLKRLGRLGALGDNWRHNHEWTLTNRTTSVEVISELGRLITFTNLAGAYVLIGRQDIPFQLQTNGGNFILGDPRSQRLHTFDASGKLTQVADGRGNTHTLHYTGNNLSSVTDGLGRTLTFQYSAGGFLTNVSDGVRFVAFTQTGNNLTSVRDPLGLVTTYAYDLANAASGLMTNAVLPEGNVPYAQTFNAQGRVATQTEAGANTHTLSYANNLTTLTDPLGRTRSHVHSANGEMLAFRDEDSEDLGMDYNANGQRTAVADRLGNLTRLGYHAPSGYVSAITNADGTFTTFDYTNRAVGGLTLFDLAQVIYPDGVKEKFTYDASGNVLTRTDRAGQVFTFTYNARGQVLTAQNPAGGSLTNTYHPNGTLASRADSDTGTTQYFYDAFSRLTNVVHPDGTKLRTAYDANDRVISLTDERTNTYTFAYDDNGNLTAVTDPLSQTAQFAYDTRDRLLQTVDRLGKMSSVSYDKLDHVASRTNRNGNATVFGYDTRRRMTSMTDPGNQVWRFGHDQEALLISASNPLNQTNRIRRDALGYEIGYTNALGETTSLARDSVRRVTATVDALLRTNGFAYDARGLLTNSTKPAAGTAAYQRDALGRLSRITDLNGSQWHFGRTPMGRAAFSADPLNRTNRFTYDSRGRLVRTVFGDGASVTNSLDPSGNVTRQQFSDGTDLQYGYDALNRLVTANELALAYDAEGRVTNTASSGVNFGAAYDADGRLTNVTYHAGAFSVRYAYDSRDRLVSVNDSLTGTTLNFGYDDAGRLISVTRPNGVNGAYTYDPAGRLTRLQEGSVVDLQYTLDPAGQVTNLDYTLPLDPTNGLSQSLSNWTYDAAHQISNAGYSYDPRGRQTVAPGRTFQYDAASRLRQINGVVFGYNGLNDIVRRAEGGVTNRYFFNLALGMKPIVAEKNENTGQVLRYYVWSPGGRLLYLIDAANGNAVRHFHFDRVGTTLALTDAAGVVTDSYAYTPYGELLARTGTSAQPFLYVGRFGVRSEPGSKLYHMRARYYDPLSARFLTHDPIWPVLSEPVSLDPYQYAADNPLSFIDPLGLCGTRFDFDSPAIRSNPSLQPARYAWGAQYALELTQGTYRPPFTTDEVVATYRAQAQARLDEEKHQKPVTSYIYTGSLIPYEATPRSERVQLFVNQISTTGRSGSASIAGSINESGNAANSVPLEIHGSVSADRAEPANDLPDPDAPGYQPKPVTAQHFGAIVMWFLTGNPDSH